MCDLSPRILGLRSSQEKSSKHILVKDLYREPITTHGRRSFRNKNLGHVYNSVQSKERRMLHGTLGGGLGQKDISHLDALWAAFTKECQY